MSWHKNGPNIWAILDSVLNMLMILLCCKQQAYYYIHISAIEEWCFLEKTYHFAVCPQSFVVLKSHVFCGVCGHLGGTSQALSGISQAKSGTSQGHSDTVVNGPRADLCHPFSKRKRLSASPPLTR